MTVSAQLRVGQGGGIPVFKGYCEQRTGNIGTVNQQGVFHLSPGKGKDDGELQMPRKRNSGKATENPRDGAQDVVKTQIMTTVFVTNQLIHTC
mmetsp:Transcript_90927/g.152268  ORF Transcript_90927/g.152268 Transcript_90927/m.152268 type:complete len:93 (+) Transcript_90927:117-395(+)